MKRVIGLPGDTVVVRPKDVLINGQTLKESYIHIDNGYGFDTYHVPLHGYFVRGDNRPISNDSRAWVHPFVNQSQMVGQAVFVISPLNALGWIN